MLRKVVITAAGLGTRLLPTTKELPKEMLPIYVEGGNGQPVLKPLLQALYEQLYLYGFREFCLVVGRGKRAIEDHFTPDWDFVEKLERKGKSSTLLDLTKFYRMLEDSVIVWVSQPNPRGFGDAVRMAHHFVGDENFLLCAGDTYIVSANNNFLQRLLAAEPRDSRGAALLVQRVDDPRQYGVVVAERRSDGLLRVSRVVEKPSTPPSNLAIMPFYVFTSYIMKALDKTPPGVGGEVQLTDAVELLIEEQGEVFAVSLADDELRLDIGTPETYLHALKSSYQYIGGGRP
ncbi:MAG: sugar phosphate nucleotidyltransferase [Candidatus Caldarchaeum sp.]|uniref:UTP--glucose-1-phosphate uridylyltransferase n=1 Tax=Caldiarchaeum subterraneum TaxID=311458 RepID=A0A7J3VSK7_CALS0